MFRWRSSSVRVQAIANQQEVHSVRGADRNRPKDEGSVIGKHNDSQTTAQKPSLCFIRLYACVRTSRTSEKDYLLSTNNIIQGHESLYILSFAKQL